MNFRRIGLGLVALIAFGTAAAGVAQTPPAPPAPPLPNTNRTAAPVLTPGPVSSATLAPNAVASFAPAIPTATPSAAPKRGAKPPASGSPAPNASPSETPQPPQFTSLDGVFEVELQPYNQRRAIYSHFGFVQDGTKVTGYWERAPGRTRTPLTGTFDGRLINIDTTDGATKVNFSGYVANFSDIVGIQKIGSSTTATPFTAQHRKKERPGK